jgi:hypothetical protein
VGAGEMIPVGCVLLAGLVVTTVDLSTDGTETPVGETTGVETLGGDGTGEAGDP